MCKIDSHTGIIYVHKYIHMGGHICVWSVHIWSIIYGHNPSIYGQSYMGIIRSYMGLIYGPIVPIYDRPYMEGVPPIYDCPYMVWTSHRQTRILPIYDPIIQTIYGPICVLAHRSHSCTSLHTMIYFRWSKHEFRSSILNVDDLKFDLF